MEKVVVQIKGFFSGIYMFFILIIFLHSVGYFKMESRNINLYLVYIISEFQQFQS